MPADQGRLEIEKTLNDAVRRARRTPRFARFNGLVNDAALIRTGAAMLSLPGVRAPSVCVQTDTRPCSRYGAFIQGIAKMRSCVSTMDKTRAILGKSERYGQHFCAEHAPIVGRAIADWRTGQATEATRTPVRVYDSDANEMRDVPLSMLFDSLRVDDRDRPVRLTPTVLGQVPITPTIYVSTLIYHLICAAWAL